MQPLIQQQIQAGALRWPTVGVYKGTAYTLTAYAQSEAGSSVYV